MLVCGEYLVGSWSSKQEVLRTPKVAFLRRRDSLLRCGARKAPHFLPWEARNASHSEGCGPLKKGLAPAVRSEKSFALTSVGSKKCFALYDICTLHLEDNNEK